MENQKRYKTPDNVLINMQIVHFGEILFRLQFLALAIMMTSVLSFFVSAIYYIFLIALAVITLFTLLAHESFQKLWQGGETLTEFTALMAQSWKYTVPIVAVLSVLSVICLCFDKNKSQIAKIIFSVIVFVIAFSVLFLKLVNTGIFQ